MPVCSQQDRLTHFNQCGFYTRSIHYNLPLADSALAWSDWNSSLSLSFVIWSYSLQALTRRQTLIRRQTRDFYSSVPFRQALLHARTADLVPTQPWMVILFTFVGSRVWSAWGNVWERGSATPWRDRAWRKDERRVQREINLKRGRDRSRLWTRLAEHRLGRRAQCMVLWWEGKWNIWLEFDESRWRWKEKPGIKNTKCRRER